MEVNKTVPFLLVTANVGSVFEDPSKLSKLWIKEFLNHVVATKPSFIALHLQEVGGKTYEKSMEYVQEFIKNLCESIELKDYNRIRVYLDEDYNSAEHFTALGNLYFAIKSIEVLKIWNFLTHEWEGVEGKNIHTGNIESVASKEKSKFPQQFFPECKWSRKGFLRTRWYISDTIFDLVNIHLFHDASNLAACEEYPSVYCKSRRRALVHTLERFHKDSVNKTVPYFVFGDFNFRCDTEGVVKKLTEDLTMHRIQNVKNDNSKVQYRDSDGSNVLTVGKKEFTHCDQRKFKEIWLRHFDRELDSLKDILFEYPITFPPSYPYEEDPQQPDNYMSTRCPAWCDRILISPAAKKLIVTEASPKYGIIGENVCMGDHKPVYLNVRIKAEQGISNYCSYDKHAQIENISHNLISSFAIDSVVANKSQCLCCYDSIQTKLNHILSELDVASFNNVNVDEIDAKIGDSKHVLKPKTPLVSINVIDTDSNVNVCMCSLYINNTPELTYLTTTTTPSQYQTPPQPQNNICPICRNIIKQQPVEHRKTLVSKRLMLANDIIVNRIDTHYLNTYTAATSSNHGNRIFEPYTPESVESHSPLPELNDKDKLNDEKEIDSEEISSTTLDVKDLMEQFPVSTDRLPNTTATQSNKTTGNSSSSCGGVSPRQLKSRLEKLKRISHASENEDDLSNKNHYGSHKQRNCCRKFCIIL